MKKQFVFVLLMLIVLCIPFSVSAAANEIVTAPQTTEINAVPDEPELIRPSPINIEQKNIDGTQYLIKTYETAVDFNPSILVEDGFEKDGYIFAYQSTGKEEKENKSTNPVTEPISVETSSKDLEDILKRLPVTKDYNDAEGFSGILTLNISSIYTEVAGYDTKTWTVSTTQEYPGLMYADPSYVPQTATKDGHTLNLADVKWVVMGTGLAGDTLVPTEYKATAVYSKKVNSQVPSGYITTANYEGTAEKTEVDTVLYKLTYIGTQIYIPPIESVLTDELQSASNIEKTPFPWGAAATVFSIILSIALLAFAVYMLFKSIQANKGIQIYNLMDKDYICIGRQIIDFNKPVLDLNPFKDMIQSNTFSFVLDKQTCKKLYGRNIAVTLDDLTVNHMVKGYNEEYRFNLELGGILDVE